MIKPPVFFFLNFPPEKGKTSPKKRKISFLKKNKNGRDFSPENERQKRMMLFFKESK